MFSVVMIRISSILQNTIKHPVYINVHKFKKVIIDALPNSAISTIFFKISILLLTGVFPMEINIKRKKDIDIIPNNI
jgi:LEA14-like dessication related protein